MKTNKYAKNTHSPRRPYRKADSREDTEPHCGKRGEEKDEKPIGRIGERVEEREPSLPANREGNAGRKTGASRPAKPNRGAARRIE